jgi:glucose-6-phosphate-specific signal transduction histidine kinase
MVARRDMTLVGLISLAAAILCVRFDLSEKLMAWAHLHERLQVDELPAVLLVFTTCLIWFSTRRYVEARRQLALRTLTDMRLADALAENQRLAQQYLDMQESERKALARDLHDELGQYLNVIKLDAVSIRDAPPQDHVQISSAARGMIENVDRLYGVVASLIRQLRPVGFDALGVAAALEHCVREWRARLVGVTMSLSIDADLSELDEVRALVLFRLIQEALTNVARHARAGRVDIRIVKRHDSSGGDIIQVSVADDGVGTTIGARRAGLGLVGMRERVAAFGGSLALTSRPGEGFKIVAAVPIMGLPQKAGDP